MNRGRGHWYGWRRALFIAAMTCLCGTTALGGGPGDQWEVRYLGKAGDSTNWLDLTFDANGMAYIAGSAGTIHAGGLDGWTTLALPCHRTDHPGLMTDGTGRAGVVYSNGGTVYYQRLDGSPGQPEVVRTSSDSGYIKAHGFFGGQAYPYLAFAGPRYADMHFASKASGVWVTNTHSYYHFDKSEFSATDGGSPSNPYLFGAEDLSGKVNLVRPQTAGYTTIIPDPGKQGLSASATAPDGIPHLLQVGGGEADELYIYTPGTGTEWVGQPTGLFPVWDYVKIRELCDLAFLSDGTMVLAYWNGDEERFHCAIGSPGNWQDTTLILPTQERAVDVALAVNSEDYPALAVTFYGRDVYYVENTPEPATLGLLAAGLGAVWMRKRRVTK